MGLFANEIRLARSAAWGLKGRSHRARQAGGNGADGDGILLSRQHNIEFGALAGAAAFPRSFRTRVTLEPNCLVQNWALKKFRGGREIITIGASLVPSELFVFSVGPGAHFFV
jgi:hypothetical protein